MKLSYLGLAIVGLILPYYFLITFLLQHGLDLPLMLEQLLATPISAFFAADLILTAIVLLFYSYSESRRLGVGNWWLVLITTLVVGPSFAFPLFLYLREGQLA